MAPGRAVQVVDRVIEVEKPVHVVKRVEVPMAPKRGDWPELFRDLAGQIDAGRVYDRDLPDVAEGIEKVWWPSAGNGTGRVAHADQGVGSVVEPAHAVLLHNRAR